MHLTLWLGDKREVSIPWDNGAIPADWSRGPGRAVSGSFFLKAWNRSEISFVCFACCLDFTYLGYLVSICLVGSFNFFFFPQTWYFRNQISDNVLSQYIYKEIRLVFWRNFSASIIHYDLVGWLGQEKIKYISLHFSSVLSSSQRWNEYYVVKQNL